MRVVNHNLTFCSKALNNAPSSAVPRIGFSTIFSLNTNRNSPPIFSLRSNSACTHIRDQNMVTLSWITTSRWICPSSVTKVSLISSFFKFLTKFSRWHHTPSANTMILCFLPLTTISLMFATISYLLKCFSGMMFISTSCNTIAQRAITCALRPNFSITKVTRWRDDVTKIL